MRYFKIIAGLVLFLASSAIVPLLTAGDVSIMIQGVDYAPALCGKVLDAIAGSLIVWGILQNPGAKKSRI